MERWRGSDEGKSAVKIQKAPRSEAGMFNGVGERGD